MSNCEECISTYTGALDYFLCSLCISRSMFTFDQTPSQTTRLQSRAEVRSLRDVMLSCDKLSVPEFKSTGSTSIDSVSAVTQEGLGGTTSWVGSFHEKITSDTPAGTRQYLTSSVSTYSSNTPTTRQLNFSTPAPPKPSRPSPTVSSVMSDRWCMESMTPNMRYTPPNMSMRGMRMMNPNAPREAFGSYKINESSRRENERGMSLCILPTPLLRGNLDKNSDGFKVFESASPALGFSRPSPTVGLPSWVNMSPTPVGPVQKRFREGYNSRHFPIPRPSDEGPKIPAPRKLSVDLG